MTGRAHGTEIGAAVVGQRSRHADDHRIGIGDHGRVRRGVEAALAHRGHVSILDVVDVRPTLVQQPDHPFRKVESDHGHSTGDGLLGQRQADVTQPKDHAVGTRTRLVHGLEFYPHDVFALSRPGRIGPARWPGAGCLWSHASPERPAFFGPPQRSARMERNMLLEVWAVYGKYLTPTPTEAMSSSSL